MPRRLMRALFSAAICGVLSAQVPDPAEDIRGPKPPIEIPVEEKPRLPLYAGAAGAVLLSAIAAYLWRKRGRKPAVRPPREVALAALSNLDASRDSLTAEAFAEGAALAVRRYIADRFGIVAPRLTTEEFLHTVASDPASPLSAQSDHLRIFLKSCDLAKFAAARLDEEKRAELIDAARTFIRSTSRATSP